MKQLWGWTATDAFGRSRPYQAYGPDVTESAMLEHLQKHFRNVTITDLKRLKDGEYIPAAGEIESHTYHFGALDTALRANGIMTYTDWLGKTQRWLSTHKPPIDRKPIIKTPLIQR